jgi:hypothetical protein
MPKDDSPDFVERDLVAGAVVEPGVYGLALQLSLIPFEALTVGRP